MKKLKEMGVFKKTVMIPAGVLAVLVLITVWALWDAENTNPIEEDGKQALKDEKKTDKEERKDLKETVGKEYPTVEEVQRYLKTKPENVGEIEYLEKEYGKEVLYLYREGKLISRSEGADERVFKESQLKAENDKNAVPYAIDLVSGGTFTRNSEYAVTKPGFTQRGDFYTGYEEAGIDTQLDTLTRVGEDGKIMMDVTMYAYATEEMTAKEFQQKIGKFEVKVNGQETQPVTTIAREQGHTKAEFGDLKIDLESKKLKDVNLLYAASNWELQDFSKAVIYPGIPIPVVFEVNVKDTLYKDATYNAEMDEFSGTPKDITITINGDAVTLSEVTTDSAGIEMRR